VTLFSSYRRGILSDLKEMPPEITILNVPGQNSTGEVHRDDPMGIISHPTERNFVSGLTLRYSAIIRSRYTRAQKTVDSATRPAA
jgi:hypothetical protein